MIFVSQWDCMPVLSTILSKFDNLSLLQYAWAFIMTH